MTTADFARYVGISKTAIEGIVREDRKRYSLATRDRLLEKLGISIEDWNGDR
jgi:transcriptional regulator with XRE-family HTH domain